MGRKFLPKSVDGWMGVGNVSPKIVQGLV